MKSSLLTKAALCICPPAVVATTAAVVPPVRHAVHHLTSPSRPNRPATRQGLPCVPVARRTLASPLPPEVTPDDVNAFTALTPPPGASGPIGPTPLNPPSFPGGPGVLVPPTAQTPGPPAVPEPEAWVTMVIGFGLIGAGVRQRRRYLVRSRAAALASGGSSAAARGFGAVAGGGMFSTAAMLSVSSPVGATAKLAQLGARALNSSLLSKAAMCICPPVAMAVATTTIPPVRHAVYSATAPKAPLASATPALGNTPLPCVPVDVPTAAEAVKQGGDSLAVFKPTPAWPS